MINIIRCNLHTLNVEMYNVLMCTAVNVNNIARRLSVWAGGGVGSHAFMCYFAVCPRQCPPCLTRLVTFKPSFVFPLCGFRSRFGHSFFFWRQWPMLWCISIERKWKTLRCDIKAEGQGDIKVAGSTDLDFNSKNVSEKQWSPTWMTWDQKCIWILQICFLRVTF